MRINETIGKQSEKTIRKKVQKKLVVPGGYRTAGREPEPARGANATSGKLRLRPRADIQISGYPDREAPGFRRLTRDSRNRRLTRDSQISGPFFRKKTIRKNRFFGLTGPK